LKTQKDNLSLLIDMTSHKAVYKEVQNIVTAISPDFDFKILNHIYLDIVALFKGKYPGYRKCNTLYHDLQHTTDCLLAQARLMHGAFVKGRPFSDDEILLSLACAFMHDTGYIQKSDDSKGTGAKYTATHVQRSIEFMEEYCKKHKFLLEYILDVPDILNCTGIQTKVEGIGFSSEQVDFLGKLLGTSDLVGQMADRTYLEKLVFLFYEFVEGKVKGYKSEFDFLDQTSEFYTHTQERLKNELDNVWQFMAPHFKSFYNVHEDLYKVSMQGNLVYLQKILDAHRKSFRTELKRAGLPDFVKKDIIESSF